ncbi:VOC family protein [Octadecabacter sp. SW4]|uniref:VOC family protein n=1 Tax=Octadecabacter sp. SW4 TaxID=2602067 RepID=UPI0011C20921|nr:VOC family protein [Octadecabacter sp. SW4]QEE35682.1 VOC family protein [Octadecabacter sp. SW4]
MARLEHVNVTVADPRATAAVLQDLFGWHTRWEGSAINGGFTVHVGGDDSYLALYTGPAGGRDQVAADNSYLRRGGLNHIGVVVDDLDAAEVAVKAAGFTPHSHADYEPGRRFYFHEGNDVEIEVVSYA